MSGSLIAAQSGVTVSGGNLTLVYVVALVAVAALGVAWVLAREVLAAGEGTEKMQEIAGAVQEGAAAYLSRQFRTLADLRRRSSSSCCSSCRPRRPSEKIGRSVFFVVGAVFSAITGYVGMWLAVRGNVRVAAAANEDRRAARR